MKEHFVKVPQYWILPRRSREALRRRVRKLEAHLMEQEAEDELLEQLWDVAEEDVACDLPYSLSATQKYVRANAAGHREYYPEAQQHPERFYRAYKIAYRAACRLFRDTQSIWDH
jgi:hypothetical protein